LRFPDDSGFFFNDSSAIAPRRSIRIDIHERRAVFQAKQHPFAAVIITTFCTDTDHLNELNQL